MQPMTVENRIKSQVKRQELGLSVAEKCGMMCPMARDWVRLGAALAAAREARGLTQVDMTEKIGVSRSAIQNIERGRVQKLTTTIRAYMSTVGWPAGSADAVLDGGEPPVPLPDNVTELRSPDQATSDLPLKVVHSLAEGPLLDATVIDIPTGSSDVRMTVVVRGDPGATPEQIREALETWRRAERHLQHLDDDDDEDTTDTIVNGA